MPDSGVNPTAAYWTNIDSGVRALIYWIIPLLDGIRAEPDKFHSEWNLVPTAHGTLNA